MNAEITVFEPDKLAMAYTADDQVQAILDRIRTDAMAVAIDISTATGRKECKSLAYKVSRTKIAFDDAGKVLVEEARKKVQTIDARRKHVRDTLDDLRDEIKKPVDDWEAAEERRKSALEDRLKTIDTPDRSFQDNPAEIRADIDRIRAVTIDESWEEYQKIAEAKQAKSIAVLSTVLEMADFRVQQEMELRRAKEAEEQARRAAEEAEKKIREGEAAKRAEEDRRRKEQERMRIEQERAARKEREDAEAARIAAEMKETEAAAESAPAPEPDPRDRAVAEIAKAITGLSVRQIAEALVDGKIPHMEFCQ